MSLASALTELQDKLNNLHTMQALFTQSVTSSKGRVLQESQGKFALNRPGLFYWNTLKPLHQTIVVRQNKAWIIDEDLSQVTIKQLKTNTQVSPALWLSGDSKTLEQSFEVEKTRYRNQEWFRLIPKDKGASFESIYLLWSGNGFSEMEIHDNLNQKTIIRFTQEQWNTELPNTLFNPSYPKDYDVIHERE